LPSLQTVFVINDKKQVIGSITDGDIRRGLINGLTLQDSLNRFIYKKFHYLLENEENFQKLKEFRKRKLKAVPLLSKDGKLIKIYDFTKIKSILPIDAVIMAGGLGRRLQPLTNDIPKSLLKVGNKEIISYNLDRLKQFGILNQFVTVNYLGEQIDKFCSNYDKEINFTIIKEKRYLGTAGSLSLIKKEEILSDTILLMNSDLLTNIDYEDFYKSFLEKNADLMVASIPYQVNLPYAIFDTNNGTVNSLKEKPNYTYYANAGIYLIRKELLDLVPKSTVFNATDLMEKIISLNKKLVHYPVRGYWLDIGKHEDYEKAQKDIAHIDFD
jgi:NDP-sugar pyrophosphorylase family protein